MVPEIGDLGLVCDEMGFRRGFWFGGLLMSGHSEFCLGFVCDDSGFTVVLSILRIFFFFFLT